MTVTIRASGKIIYVSNTPSQTKHDNTDAFAGLRGIRLDPSAMLSLRQLLTQDMGGAVNRLSDQVVVTQMIQRLKAGRWTIAVTDVPNLFAAGSVGANSPSGKGGAAGSGAGSGASSAGAPGTNSKKTWIEFDLLDKNKCPIQGVAFEITLPSGEVKTGKLGDKGSHREDGIDPGTCHVRFPELDGREWAKAGVFAEGKAVTLFTGKPTIPAGPYTVKQGDHMSSIAYEAGFIAAKTIWEDGANAALAAKRNQNVLLPGDVVQIPVKVKRDESVPTTDYHTFQAQVDLLQLKIVVVDWDNTPLADIDVDLDVEGADEKTKTITDGSVKRNIPLNAHKGNIKLLNFDMPVKIGHMDPVEEFSGQLWRLNNLGYRPGDSTKPDDPLFLSAVEEFQCDNKIKVTGKVDGATQDKLKTVHGC